MDNAVRRRNSQIQEFIRKEIAAGKAPGIQYCVVDKSSKPFDFAGGFADILSKKPVHPNTTMMIYSMTKTITAAAVLQLIEAGKAALNDSVSRYLDDIPYGDEVTIRHLLSQTSGIRNPIPIKWVHPTEEHAAFDEDAAFHDIIKRNADLDFVPGMKNGYSNISYWLLGHVVARVSGRSYEDYVQQNIFKKLNIPADEIGFVIPSRNWHAKGYLPKWSFLNLAKPFLIDSRFVGEYENGWLHILDHYLNGPSFGGIVASARAIGEFLQDQLRDIPMLFSNSTKDLFFAQQKDKNAQFIAMTLGWHIRSDEHIRYYFKEGGGGGFHCEMRVYPNHGMASVVIANNASFNAGNFLDAADSIR
jgi:D-alanyl-D-alanine carboxypeptidase